MPWKSAEDLTDAEIRQLLAAALNEISHLRRVAALLGGLVCADNGDISPPPPPEVRNEMLAGIRAYLDMVIDVSDAEQHILNQQLFEQHLN